MKRVLLTLALSVATLSSFAQTTIYDGETTTPDFWDLGGNPPNGADCHAGEGWKLYVSGRMDILTEGVANPDASGLNTTGKVVRFVRAKVGEGWAGASLNIASLNLNISQTNKFSILVNKPVEGNVTMKLEGAGSQEVTAYYSSPGQWQKLEFTFNSTNFTGAPATLLVFPHNQSGLTENTIIYFDEVTMYDASNNPTVLYNGDGPQTLGFLDGYWGPNGDLNNLQTDVFPNLYKTGINTSNHVMRFLRAKDGKSWCGIGLGGQDFNVASTPVFSLMINKPVSGKVGMKLEGAGAQELYADYTTPGEWAKLTFTFDPAQFTGHPNTLIIFPHFEDTDLSGQNLLAHTPMYIDNVTCGASLPTSVNVPIQEVVPVSYKIFSLSGEYLTGQMEMLNNGIYIKKTFYSNGTVEASKFVIVK
ncbi:MAG: hypothetical protein Q8909_05650 [Bacteroidota bacterium]|nr:hypothetical protein [Bacteroidota bacterium]